MDKQLLTSFVGKRRIIAQEMLDHLNVWQNSGISQAAYCRKHKLHKSKFVYWKRRFQRMPKKNVAFVPVVAKAEPKNKTFVAKPDALHHILSLQEPSLKLEVLDRFKIEVPENFSASTLTKLVITLEAL